MKLVALFLALLLSARAEAALRTVFLDREAEIEAEYCRSEVRDPVFGTCAQSSSHPKMALIYAPEDFGQLIVEHLGAAWSAGYYDQLNPYDLFHGHLILTGPKTSFDSPEEYFAQVSAVLYHTAERTHRWEREGRRGIALNQRTPRSLVGFPSGSLSAVRDVLRPNAPLSRNYENAGSVSEGELVDSLKNLSTLPYKTGANASPPLFSMQVCRDGKCSACDPESGFLLVTPEAKGRFRSSLGERFEVYVRCDFADRADP